MTWTREPVENADFPGSGRDAPGLPWWLRVLDALTVVAGLLALLHPLGVRPRVQIGPIVISLRSFLRPIVCAAGAATLRHLLRARPSLLRRVAAWPRTGPAKLSHQLARWPALRAALVPFLFSRAAVLFVGYFAVLMIGYPTGAAPWRFFMGEFANLPAKWDANYYWNIARYGYTWSGDPHQQGVLAFFPAYPMAARVVGWLCGSLEAALFIVALGAFLWALIYVYRLAREHLDRPRAEAALLFLAFYPFGVFYSADYTESMFLLASVAAFYHFRRAQWLKASAWGILLSLTRPNGFLLSAALGVAALERAWRERRQAGEVSRDESRSLLTSALVASVPILGVAAHSVFIYSLTGDPLMWMRVQQAWGRAYHGPLVLGGWLAAVLRTGFLGYAARSPTEAIQAIAALFALTGIWSVARRFGLAYGVFIALNILPPLITGGMLSVGRFTATLFPLFFWLAAAVPARQRPAWVGLFAALQAFVAVMFYTWRALA